MKLSYVLLSAACGVAFVSCENPADQTTDAVVAEEQEVAQAAIEAVSYQFLASSTVGFTGSKVTDSHSGGFKSVTGGFKVIDGMPVSGSLVIDMTSMWSDAEKLTQHLKNADFFNVEQFPESLFEVTAFEKGEGTEFMVSGNLTMLGVTKNITFPALVTQGEEEVTLTSEFDINRQNWGISYPGRKDDLIRDEVVIEFNLKAAPGGDS